MAQVQTDEIICIKSQRRKQDSNLVFGSKVNTCPSITFAGTKIKTPHHQEAAFPENLLPFSLFQQGLAKRGGCGREGRRIAKPLVSVLIERQSWPLPISFLS